MLKISNPGKVEEWQLSKVLVVEYRGDRRSCLRDKPIESELNFIDTDVTLRLRYARGIPQIHKTVCDQLVVVKLVGRV